MMSFVRCDLWYNCTHSSQASRLPQRILQYWDLVYVHFSAAYSQNLSFVDEVLAQVYMTFEPDAKK